MANQLNGAQQFIPMSQDIEVKSLTELPKAERRQITTELIRIHNLVNSTENDLRKLAGDDKADRLRID